MVDEIKRPRLTVGALVFNKENKLLLLKSPKWHGKYIVPCGHVEFGEKLLEAVKREVKEETNLDISDIKFLKVMEFINSEDYHKGNLHFVGLQYTAKTSNENITLNNEAESFVWTDLKDSLNLDLEPETRNSIQTILDNK